MPLNIRFWVTATIGHTNILASLGDADREPVERWGNARATLLGDAAHPMTQYMAQGACMALEDAVTLGEAVKA